MLERLNNGLKRRLNQRGIILMYHRVADLSYDPWSLSVAPGNFDEQMRVLKKYGRPVLMKELGENYRKLTLGPKDIAVTFDDGYSDNFHIARPILEKQGVPATFYIVSGKVSSRQEFWWDELARIILSARSLPEVFELNIAGNNRIWRVSREEKIVKENYTSGQPESNTVVSKCRLYFAVWELLRELNGHEREECINRISRWAGDCSPVNKLDLAMPLDELRSLAGSGLFEIGAHTVHHPRLTSLPLDEQRDEIANSKEALEEMLRRDIVSFSYPFGDHSIETVGIVRSLGFTNACITAAKPVMRDCDPYALPRFNVLNWDGGRFEQNLQKWLFGAVKK